MKKKNTLYFLAKDAIIEDSIALRVSGQLLLGVCKIYSKKTRYLLEDCNDALMKIKMAFRPGAVDLAEGNAVAPISSITLSSQSLNFNMAIPEPTFDMAAFSKMLNTNLPTPAKANRLMLDKVPEINEDIDMVEVSSSALPGLLEPLSGPATEVDWSSMQPDIAADVGDWDLDLQLKEDVDADLVNFSAPQSSLEIEVGRDAVETPAFQAANRFGDDTAEEALASDTKDMSDTSFLRRDADKVEEAFQQDSEKFDETADDSVPSLPFQQRDFDASFGQLESDQPKSSKTSDSSFSSVAALAFKDVSTLEKTSGAPVASTLRSRRSVAQNYAIIDEQTEIDASFIKRSLANRSDILNFSVSIRPWTTRMWQCEALSRELKQDMAKAFSVVDYIKPPELHIEANEAPTLSSVYKTAEEIIYDNLPQSSTIYDSASQVDSGDVFLSESTGLAIHSDPNFELDSPVATEANVAEEPEHTSSIVEERAFEQQTNQMLEKLKAKFAAQSLSKEVEDFRPIEYRQLMDPPRKRKEAVSSFYQLLYLTTKDYISLEQLNPFGKIEILPKPKLFKIHS